MSTFAYGIKALSPTSAFDSHILGYATARTDEDDSLLQIWNGGDQDDLVFVIRIAGELEAGDGDVDSPAYGFRADVDNGIYRIGTDNWAGTAGGVKVIDFTATTVSIPVDVIMSGLPTSDPSVAGQLWNSTGTLMVSAG